MQKIFHDQTINDDHVLLVVSAKEEGKIYELMSGKLHHRQHVVKHPPTRSDNEGFSTRTSNGMKMGSGSVREDDDEHNLQQYLSAMAVAVREQIEATKPRAVIFFEPEHLKEKLAPHITLAQPMPMSSVLFGNFVHESPNELHTRLAKLYTDDHDPASPDSVTGEENAAEKRSILEIPKQN